MQRTSDIRTVVFGNRQRRSRGCVSGYRSFRRHDSGRRPLRAALAAPAGDGLLTHAPGRRGGSVIPCERRSGRPSGADHDMAIFHSQPGSPPAPVVSPVWRHRRARLPAHAHGRRGPGDRPDRPQQRHGERVRLRASQLGHGSHGDQARYERSRLSGRETRKVLQSAYELPRKGEDWPSQDRAGAHRPAAGGTADASRAGWSAGGQRGRA